MVLIAAIGVGIALVQSFLSDTHSLPIVDREWGWMQLEWRPESTWIDRCCRVLGLCWIGWAVIGGIVIPEFYFIMLLRMYGF